MIQRYCLEEMANLWDLESKYKHYLQVELAVCKAYHELNEIPDIEYQEIVSKADFNTQRIQEIEAECKHDVIAFLTCLNENLGDLSKHIHKGLTSSDVIDTAFSLSLKSSSIIISDDMVDTIILLKKLALEHKDTVCIGRSHGIHAEIMTFGTKLLNWLDIFERTYKNFLSAVEDVLVGQISGPVGTYSNIPPKVEKLACKYLGLKPAKISTQILSRDIHARYLNELAIIATVIEQFATEIRSLQRSEISEVQEGFSENQKGSSAMPHKRNPILCENLCGLARVVRNNAHTAMENIVLWHERDISHSSAERIVFPDSLILVDFMLNRFQNVLKNLVVKKDNMRKNANYKGGVIYSQKVLLKLTEKGLPREEAYKIVQNYSLDAIDNNKNFKTSLLQSPEVLRYLSVAEIEDCFNETAYLANIDTIFDRFKLNM